MSKKRKHKRSKKNNTSLIPQPKQQLTNSTTLWQRLRNSLPWKQIALDWDFIDTTGCTGVEIGSLVTDFIYFITSLMSKEGEIGSEGREMFSVSGICTGISIAVILAYYERLSHRALHNLIDPEPNEKVTNTMDEVSLTPSQKTAIAVETLTHTLEKANGVTQAARFGIGFFSKMIPGFSKYELLAKGITHTAALCGSFLASGQEAINIANAFQHENKLANH